MQSGECAPRGRRGVVAALLGRWRRAKLATKLCLALYLALVPVFGATLLVGADARARLEASRQDLVTARQVKDLADQALALMLVRETITQSILLDPENITEAGRKIEAYDATMAAFARMKELSRSDEVRRVIDALTAMAEGDLQSLDTAILESVGDGKADVAKKQYFEAYGPRRAEFEAQVRRLGDLAEEEAQAAAARASENTATALSRVAGALGCGIALAGVVLLLATRRIGRRLRGTVDAVRALATGDLSGRLPAGSGDEVGQMAEAFNQAVAGMRGAVGSDRVDWALVARQKEREQELCRILAMIEGAPLNVLYADRDLTVRYVNPAFVRTFTALERHLGVAVGGLVGRRVTALHPALAAREARLLDAGQPAWQEQAAVGPEVMEFLVSPIRDASGAPLGVMLTCHAVTEQLERERREREQAAELWRKAEALSEVVRAAAEGDLTREVTVRGDDALGGMGEALEQFFHDLRGRLGAIGRNARGLAGASEGLTSVGQEMEATAERTLAQAQEVNQASERVTRNVGGVAEGITEMRQSIGAVARSASQASAVAERAVGSAEAANATVTQLGSSGAEIGTFIKVIANIAGQTNLLALNATIEAARAGEHGKGFAVVANEVKELAKETTRAADEIRKKIEAIQNDTRAAVGAIADVSGVIAEIRAISGAIAEAVEEQTATAAAIGRNIDEAVSAGAAIEAGIRSAAGAAEGTSAGAAANRKAADGLAGMAAELEQLIVHFHCGETADAADGREAPRPAAAPRRPTAAPPRRGKVIHA